MTKLDRKDIKIFADDNVTDQIVQFGSTRLGAINPSKDPDVLQNLSNYLLVNYDPLMVIRLDIQKC